MRRRLTISPELYARITTIALVALALIITTGAAVRLTLRPYRAMVLAATGAVLCLWLGLGASYAVPRVPPSFGVLSAATLLYLGAAVATRRRGHGHRASPAG